MTCGGNGAADTGRSGRRTSVGAVMRVIAIDGPAGTGKSTVARLVADRLGFGYLDTGAMYRAVTAAVLRAGIATDDAGAVAERARTCDLQVGPYGVFVDAVEVTEEIRGPLVTAAVSAVAANAEVRAELVRRQREWIALRPGAVLEGRDIGTVVVPDARLKVFLTASAEARAARRAGEGTTGSDTAAVAADLARRDELDSTRAASPLATAADAVTVDTTDLTIDEVVAEVVRLWQERDVPTGSVPHPAADRSSGPTVADRDPAAATTGAAARAGGAGHKVESELIDRAWNAGEPTRWARLLYTVVRSALVGFCYLWFRLEITGRDHVPTEGAFILAPVHRSNLDTPIVAAVTRRPMRFMGKDSLWGVHRAFSWFISALGAFPVARGTVDREALRRCQSVLEAGQPLVLYPEGTRQLGPQLHELFDGPAFLALRTGVPVVPVGIGGSERAQAKGSKLIRPTKVRVVIGPPILPPVTGEGRATSRRAVRELTAAIGHDLQLLFDQAQAGLPAD